MPKTKPAEKWRDWTAEDRKQNPKRVCSVAGCGSAPVRVKETKATSRVDGTPTTRRHVYCATHKTVEPQD